MNFNISRRGFLKGTGVVALGALAAGNLTGCGNGTELSSAEASEELTDVRTQAYRTPTWLGDAPEVAESDITETVDTEVLVVGCRTGGLPAIISAAENGAQVLGIDQCDTVRAPREDIGAIDSALQKEWNAEHPEYAIDKMKAMEDIIRYSDGFASYDLIKVWEDESGALVDWITDIIERDGVYKMHFEAGTDEGRVKTWATSHSPEQLLNTDDSSYNFGVCLSDYAKELGAEFRWSTSLVKCEQDSSGRVTGVIARDDNDKHYIRINASKGVILSTGGYAANTEMLEARQPWNQRERINIPLGGGNSGDGIKAALWCGAHMDAVGAACMFNRASVKPGQYVGSDVQGKLFWMGEQPWLKVNLRGERFCNESGPYDYMLHAAYSQPHHMYVSIFDSDYAAQAKTMNEYGCCRLYPWDDEAPSNKDISDMPAALESLEENGYLQKADTIEELADKLGIPADTTAATVAHYNEMAAAGEDTDYNKESNRILPLSTPPYYGIRTGAWYLATLDGVSINTDMHPVDDEGDPIEGLYLTGNDSGGFFALSYPDRFVGLACGRTMTFGRRAGRLAATQEA